MEYIDGPAGTLGSAGPRYIRHSYIPMSGLMRFDSADFSYMSPSRLETIVLHEMGHVLGIGSMWRYRGHLVPSDCRNLTQYGLPVIGARHIGPYTNASLPLVNRAGTLPYAPVEDQYGMVGTTCGHWREGTFGNELMTGFLDFGSNPLSYLTAYSLRDIGYEIDENSSVIDKTYDIGSASYDVVNEKTGIMLQGCFDGIDPPKMIGS